MIKSILILSCILAILQLGNISHASNQPDWSTGNDKVSIPNEKTIFNDQEKDGTNRTKRNVVLLIPVSTSEEADNSQEEELSEEVDQLNRHGHKTKRCKAPNPLRKARRIPVMKNPQQYFPVSTEGSVDNSVENSGEGRSYFRLASMKDAKNILKSILKSRSTKREDNDAIVETVSNPQDQASISLLTKSAKRSGQRGKKYVCYCIEDNCGSKKTKNPSRPYAMKRPIGPNVLAKSVYSGKEENRQMSGSPLNNRQTLGALNDLQCPPGAVLVEESDYAERPGRKYNPKRRPDKKFSSIITPCDSEGPSIGQPTRINIPLSGNRKLNRCVYKVDRKLPYAQKLQSVIEQNKAHRESPCSQAKTSNNNGIDRQDYYDNDQQSNLNQYAQIPLAPNLVYPSPYAVYPQYPQLPQYPQYDDALVGEPQSPLQLVNPPCEEYQKLPYEATPLGRNFIDINECIKMFGRKFCIITTTTITSLPENAVNYGNENEEPVVDSHWDEEIEQSNTESPHRKTTWGYPAKVYDTNNVASTHFQEPESSDHVDDDCEDHLRDSDPYPPSRIEVTSGPYRVGTTHYFSNQWENKKIQPTDNFSPGTVQSYGVVGSNQEKSAVFDEHENLINPNSPLRYNDPGKLEYLIPDSDESIESEAQDMYELADEAKESEAPNTLSSERITEFSQLGSTIPSSSWQGVHRISSPQYLEYTVKPTEYNISPSSSEDISEEITERIPTTHDSNLSQYETTQYRYSTQSSHQQQGKNGNAVVDYYTRRPSERVGMTKQHTMDGSLDNDTVENLGSSASPNTVYAKMEEPWVDFRTTVPPQHSKGNELQSSEEITTIYPVIDNEDRSVSTSSRAQSIDNRVNGYSVSPSSNLYYSIQPDISTGDYESTNAKITSSNRQEGIVESIPIKDYPKLGFVASTTSGNNGYASSDATIKNTGFYTTPYYAEETKTASSWPQEVGEKNTKYDFKESPSTQNHMSHVNEYSTAARNFYPHFLGSHQSINDEHTTEKSEQQFFKSDAAITENYISTLKSSDSVGNTADATKNKYTISYKEYPFVTEQSEDVTNNYDGVASRHWYYTPQSGRKITSSTDRQTSENRNSQGQYVGTYHSIPSGITSTPVRPDLSEKPAFYSDKINLSTTTKGHEDDSQRPTKTSPQNTFYSTPSDRPSFTTNYRTSLEPDDLKSIHSTGDDYSNEDMANNYTTSQTILGTTIAVGDGGKTDIQHDEVSRYSDQGPVAFIATPGEYEHYNKGKSPLSGSENIYTPIITTGLVGDQQRTTEMAPKYTFYSTQSEKHFATDSHRASTVSANLELVHFTGDDDYSNEDTTNSFYSTQSEEPFTTDTHRASTESVNLQLVHSTGDDDYSNEDTTNSFYSTQSEEPFTTDSHRASTESANLELVHSTGDDDYSNEDTTNSFYSTQSEEPFTTDFHRPSTESANLELVHSTGDDDYSNEDTTNSFYSTQSEEPFTTDSHRPSTESANLELVHSTGDDDYSNEDTTNSFYSTQSEEPFTTDSHRPSTESVNLKLVHSTGDDDYSNEDSTNSYITSQSILSKTKTFGIESSQKSHPFITTPRQYNYYEATYPQGHLLQPSGMTSNYYDGKVGDVIRQNFNNEEVRVKTVNDFTTMSSRDLRVNDRNDEINDSTILKHVDGVTRPETLASSSDHSEEYTTTHDFIGKDISQTEIIGDNNNYDDYSTIKPMTQIIYEQRRPYQGKKYEGTHLTTSHYETISPQSRKETTKVTDEDIFGQSYRTELSHEDITSQRTILDNPAWNILKISKSTATSEIPTEEKIGNPLGASHSKSQSSVTRHFENPSRIPNISNGENMVRDSMTTEVERNYDSTTNQYSQSILKTGVNNPIEDEYSEDDGNNSFSSIHQEKTSPQPVVGNNLPPMDTSESDSLVYNDTHNLTTISDKLSTITNEKPQLTTHEFVGDTMTDEGSSTTKNNDSVFTSNAPSSTQMKNSDVLKTEPHLAFSTNDQNDNLEDASLLNNDKIAASNDFSTETSITEEFTPSYDTLRSALKAVTATDMNTEATTRLVTDKITQQDDISENITSSKFTPFSDKVGDGQDTITTSKENDAKTIGRITNNSELPFNEYLYVTDHLPYVKSQRIEYSTHPYKSISSATVVGNTFRSQSLPDSQDVTSSTVEYGESRRPEYDSTLMNKESVGTALKTHSITTTMPTDTLRPISTVDSTNNSDERYGPSSSPSGIVLQPHYDDYQTVATIGSSTNGVSTEYSPYTKILSATMVDNILKSQSSPESQDITSSIAEYEDSTRSEHDLTPKNDKSVESILQMHSTATTDTADILRSMLTDEPASNSHEEHGASSSTNNILLQPYYTDSQTISIHGSSTQNPQTDYSPYKSISTASVVGNTLASQSFSNSEDVTSCSIECEDSSSSEHASISENKESVGTALHTLSITTPDSAKISSPISMPESASYHYDTYDASSSTNNIALQPHYTGYQAIPTKESPTQSPRTESSLHKISSSATLGNTLESQSFADFEDVTSSSMEYEGSTSSEHYLTPINQGSAGAALHTYSATTTQSTDKFMTNSAKESMSKGATSSTIGIELPSPYSGYHIIPKSDNTEEVVRNNHISDKDQHFLRTAVQKVVNDLISPKSNNAYKNGSKAADWQAVGAPNEGLLTKLPVLENLFSLPEVKDLVISNVKGLITEASGVPQDSSLGRLEDHVIESVLNNVVNELIPGPTSPSSSMDVDEHRFENGRWTAVPATSVPGEDNDGLPDDKVSSTIRDILRRPGIGLQGAKLPIVQNIIVRAVENVLKKAKNVVGHSVIWDTLNKIITRAEKFDKPLRVLVPTTKPLPKPPGIKTPSAPMKNLPVIPITERVFKNGQWSEKHTVVGKMRKDFGPKQSTSSTTTSRYNNELRTSSFSYQSSSIEANEPDYTTKPADYALLGESEENSEEATLKHVIGMTDIPNEPTIEAAGNASKTQNIDDKENFEKSPIKYFSPHDRILTYIKNHQTPAGKIPTTLSSLDTQHITEHYRPWTVIESNEAGMDDESGKFQHLPASNNDKVPTGLTEEPRLGATEKVKTCKCMDEEEKHIDNKVGLSQQNSSQEFKTITPVAGEKNDLYSPSTIHHLDIEDGEETDYTTEEFIGENNPQMNPNSRKDAKMEILSTESQEFSSTIHHLDVIEDNAYSTEEYMSNENLSTEKTTFGLSEEVGNTQLSSPQSTVNYLYEDEESAENATQAYTDEDNTSTTDSAEKQFTEKQSPSQSTDSTAYFDIGSQTAKVGNTRNFDQGFSTTDVLKTTIQGEDRVGITREDGSTTQTLDRKISKLMKHTGTTSKVTTASRGLVGAAKRPEESELLQENLKDSPSFVTPKWDPTYFGRISPSNRANLDGDKISDLANTELFYVGDGVKIPLTIRRMPDGSYALSISEKICEKFVNRECPCCVPKEGDIVEEKRQLNDPEDAEYETASSKNTYGSISFEPTESSEYENKSKKRYVRSTSGSDVIVTSASPVSSFIQKYNLTLNLKDDHDSIGSSITNRKTADEIKNKNKLKFSRSSHGAKMLNLFENNNMIQRDDSEEERPIIDDNSEIISKESNTIRKSEFTYNSDTNSFIRSLVNIRDVPENKRAEVILNALDGLINSATAKKLDSTGNQNTMKIIDDTSTNDQDSSDLDFDEVENEMARYGYQKDNPILERIRYIKKYQHGHGRYKYQQNIDHHARGKMNVLKTVLHWLKEVFLESKANSKK